MKEWGGGNTAGLQLPKKKRLEMRIQRGKVLATPHPPYPSDIVQSVESDEDVGRQRNGMRQFYTLLGLLKGGLK